MLFRNAVRNITISLVTLLMFNSQPLLGQEVESRAEAAGESDARIDAIFEQLRLSLARLRTIQYKAAMEQKQHLTLVPNPDKPWQKPYNIEYDIEYAIDGNKFFSHVMYTDLDGQKQDIEFAYDGEHYQRFEEKSGLLEFTSNLRVELPTQAMMIQPIVFPFIFSFAEKDQFDYGVLLNEGTWDKVRKRASYIGTEMIDGENCQLVKVLQSRMGMERNLTIYFSEDKEYYPIRTIAEDERSITQIDVIADAKETDQGIVYIPISIDAKSRGGDGDTLMEEQFYRIDEESLAVNQPIDPNKFVINENRAWNGVVDEDSNIFTQNSRGEDSQRSWVVVYYLLFGVCLLIVSVVLWKQYKSWRK